MERQPGSFRSWGQVVVRRTVTRALPVLQCDQVMEFSWSALWNITDETPDNCQMFLNCHGMSLFLECLEVSDEPLQEQTVLHLCLLP